MPTLQALDTVVYEVQQACIQLGLPVPIGVYDVEDDTAKMMGSAVNLAGILINSAYPWQQQRAPVTFAGDGSTTEFDLPADFSRFVDGTGWSSAMRRPVVPLNPQQWWQATRYIGGSVYINPACRIWQNKLAFLNAPASGDTISFEYIKRTWVQDADTLSIYKQKADKNGDTPQFDWLLMVLAIKAKWLELKAMDNAGAMSDFNDRLKQLTYEERLAPILDLSGRGPYNARLLDGLNVPNTGFGS